MDGAQFDGLMRQVTTARSRRGALLGVLGGMVGLLGLTETDAKHKKKHKKKKGGSLPVSPPPSGPACPASCPACQECINGASCTVQSDFTPCEGNPCKSCRGGACVNRGNGAECGEHRRCRDGVCTPIPATCSDGRQNGDESDTDCGGSCDRCANGKACTSIDDCDSARCTGGRCATCATHDECGSGATGTCACYDGVCYATQQGQVVPQFSDIDDLCWFCPPSSERCAFCPGGTVMCAQQFGTIQDVVCYPRCGQSFDAR
jgi:hypothetical protein